MIDTDKYEGHKPAPWKIACWDRKWYIDYNEHETVCRLYGTAQRKDPTAKLIADAPLLLEEVKRLQKELRKQTNIVGMISDLVYDGGSHNLTWDEFNEILGDVMKE